MLVEQQFLPQGTSAIENRHVKQRQVSRMLERLFRLLARVDPQIDGSGRGTIVEMSSVQRSFKTEVLLQVGRHESPLVCCANQIVRSKATADS
jgi:hypothetical protein